MRKRLRYSLLLPLLAFCYVSLAQQQSLYTQYMFNGLAINPAYAGSQESIIAAGHFRKQWVGIQDAPQTQTFSAHAPLDRIRYRKRPGSNVSLGLMLFNDRIAITNTTGMYAAYAYRIKLMADGYFSMGIQAGINQMRIKYSELGLDDPSFLMGDITEWSPNFGGGLYYHTQRFYAGLSMPHILHKSRDRVRASTSMEPQLFLSAGYVFDLPASLKLKPNLLIKSISGNPVQFDVNCNLFLSERLELGVSWRSFESVSSLIRIKVSPRFTFGYAYDMPSGSELSGMSNGSHEMAIRYRTLLKRVHTVSPRYF